MSSVTSADRGRLFGYAAMSARTPRTLESEPDRRADERQDQALRP